MSLSSNLMLSILDDESKDKYDIYRDLGFILTVIRDNTSCDETSFLIDMILKKLSK
jgi:hypothetical protein